MRANPHSRAPLAPLAALAVALAISVCGCGSPEPQTGATSNPAASKALASEQSEVSIASLTFSQLNIDFDGDLHPQSEWGAATVQYVGADNTLYFNLAVNDVWRIQNIPLLSREGDGVLQSSNVNFDLGNTPGALVTTLQYAASLTTAPITQMPAGATAAAVGQQDYTIFTGLIGGTVPFTPPTPALVGGGGNGPKTTHSDGFPNQQAGKNECGPAAASNSLQWLKKKHNLAIPDAAITIAALKAALGWTPTGVPGNWWNLKQQYLKGQIQTGTLPRFSMDLVEQKLKQDCDVELTSPSRDKQGNLGSHIVAITGIQPLANGDYELELTHDADQKDPNGGTVTENVIFHAKTNPRNTLEGAPWINGFKPELIVFECPDKKAPKNPPPPPPPPPPPGPPPPPPGPPPPPPPGPPPPPPPGSN